ncbi:MAG: sigma factor G inhibitor Gin [Peptococcaceae bacterium]|nr:sigma factor G inhibitor Gin [Peptococcaceae bacterium]
MSAAILPLCCHCGKTPRRGLHDGFRLRGKLICHGCESLLSQAEQNSLDYLEFMGTIRSLVGRSGRFWRENVW